MRYIMKITRTFLGLFVVSLVFGMPLWAGGGNPQSDASLKDAIAAQRSRESFSVINEASAASLEPVRLIDKAVRACDGLPEAVDVEESNPR